MDNEPVKVKMQLHAARPSVQGAAPVRPAAQAAIEAVEARWRAEDKKVKSERRKKRFVGCLSWLFLLLVAAGAAWYFLGEKYLPAQYTFPRVREFVMETVSKWRNPSSSDPQTQPHPKAELSPVDAADSETAAVRSKIKTFVSQLETLCSMDLEETQQVSNIQLGAWPVGKGMLNEILSADRWYFKTREKLIEMETQNEKSQKLRNEERSARKGEYANQYRPHEINRQRNEVEGKLESCRLIRVQAIERAIKAIKAASAKWTGPESRKDVARLLKRLDALDKQFRDKLFKDKKVKIENHHDGVAPDSMKQQLETMKQNLETIN